MNFKPNTWAALFGLSLSADIIAIQASNETAQFIAKPLVILTLIGFFYSAMNGIVSDLKKWIYFALIFSWLGDVLLMFQSRNELFFLLGLSSFLLAHIFYCIFFHLVRIREGIRSKLFTLLVVGIYYTGLISILSPFLGDMKLPVRIYGLVISFMFMLAMHMGYLKNRSAGRLMLLGAALFVVSDSLLAIDKFYQSFRLAGLVVMLTYGMAQLMIVAGVVRYLSEKR